MSMETSFESVAPRETCDHDGMIESFARDIVDDPMKEKLYRDFMWQFVGDPESAERGVDQTPYPLKTWNDELHVYSTYVGGFFIHETNKYGRDVSKIIGVRSVESPESAGERAKNYMVVECDFETGEQKEPIVHRAYRTGTEKQPDMAWQLLDEQAYQNWPPGKLPGLNAPAYAQDVLSLPAQQPAMLRYGLNARYQLYDLAPLIERINGALIERDGQLEVVNRELGASALSGAQVELVAA